MAVDHLAVGDETRSEARTERNHDEVAHALGIAVDHLADRRGIGVVRHEHLHTPEAVPDVVRQRENAAAFIGIGVSLAEFPEVRGVFDRTFMIIGIGGTDTDTRQFVLERKAVGQCVHRLAEVFDIGRIIVYTGVFLGRNDRFGIQVAVFVDDAERSIDTADVHADSEFFHIVFWLKVRIYQVKVNPKFGYSKLFSYFWDRFRSKM